MTTPISAVRPGLEASLRSVTIKLNTKFRINILINVNKIKKHVLVDMHVYIVYSNDTDV